MRSLLDLRLSRWALLLLALVSAGATVVILTGAGQRTPAQMAALVALREPPTALAAARSAGATAGGGSGAGATTPAVRSGASTGRAKRRFTHAAAEPGASSATTPAVAATPSVTATTQTAASPTSTATTNSKITPATSTSKSDLPKVGHVFEIVLSAPSYAAAFGRHSELTYLRSLIAKGTLLSGYRSLGRGELADELALVSGQAPNPETSHGCPTYTDFPESAIANAAGIVHGRGCVYPDSALTIGDQVTASGKVWHAYVADMGKETCVHPNSGATDDIALPDTQPGYDTRHNPFIYFHSLLDLGDCANDDVDLAHLATALRSPERTPEFDYLAADACADGDPTPVPASSPTTTTTTTTSSTSTAATSNSTTTTTTPTPTPTSTTTTSASPAITTATSTSTPAVTTSSTSTTTTTSATTSPATTPATTPAGCPPNAPTGLVAENAFLRQRIPQILNAPAYRRNGVLVIAVADSAKASGHPVRTGALVLSRWVRRGRRIAAVSNPYALLRLTEDSLGFTPLANARSWRGLAAQVLRH